MATYGLLGKNISYSFSKSFFQNFFEENKLHHQYLNFDIDSISDFSEIIKKYTDIQGFNVTIPYKELIIPFLDFIDKDAQEIGAVNCIKIDKNKKLTGYNTDHFGFEKSLNNHLVHQKKALVLGSGGASKAVIFALKKMNIAYQIVSRKPIEKLITYQALDSKLLSDYQLLINCTPLGSAHFPKEFPPLPYEALTIEHLLFDLTYNPSLTPFLEKGKQYGATIVNGLEMLSYQAEKSWQIWNLS